MTPIQSFACLAAWSTLTAVSVASISCARHGGEKSDDAGAAIHCVDPMHDFGAVSEGDTLRHTFVVRNDGTTALDLGLPSTNCVCATADIKTRHLPPGATSEVQVSFDTLQRTGAQTKLVWLVSQAAPAPLLALTLKAKVEPMLEIREEEEDEEAEMVHIEERNTRELWITGARSATAAVKFDRLTGGCDNEISAEVLRKTEGDKLRQGLRMTVHWTRLGHCHGTVEMTTGLEQMPKLVYPFEWTVLGNIEVLPRAVTFFPREPSADADHQQQTVQVKSRRPDFAIKSARAVSGPFKVVVRRQQAAGTYDVLVQVTDRDALARTQVASIELLTNDPYEPTLRIPVAVSTLVGHPTPSAAHSGR